MNWKQFGLIIVGVIVFIMAGCLVIYFHVTGQEQTIVDQAKAEAHAKTPINEVTAVDVYNGTRSYVTVQGKSRTGEPLIAWINGSKVNVEDMNRIVNKSGIITAIKQKNPGAYIVHVIPGQDGNQKFWEALFIDSEDNYNYYYVDIYSGQVTKTYRLQKATS
ncbi:DUF5590 domain-containing protein [Aneurinibacillus sp. Ricciae_BoGa-3]|uniref:cell wall elongation regulator TseB-like domain-containing protein n=1 Tax=Aneurinibacillus sp. Ricciae_BoGa-3 TaxID=3022697 RepID=UPI002341FDA6|nr:DUF5590 domain-containing protein [Aneurinibacillus sp. Ricciae_BoGa-3]WCK56123.1 DUF5590 domain-containing protein [Aneurinibacillus sp. Ricciae_BoGa-3]